MSDYESRRRAWLADMKQRNCSGYQIQPRHESERVTPAWFAKPNAPAEVTVDVWSHPEWDMKLIVEANSASEETARENLHPDHDPKLLTKQTQTMPRDEFEKLPEWDG